MFCMSCGTQLLDEANFCWKCGKPQKTGVVADQVKEADDAKYEMCAIVDGKEVWVADAVGPEGKYVAGASRPLSSQAHKELVYRLIGDGWEQTDRGEERYDLRFRRKLDPSWDRCIIDYAVKRVTTRDFKLLSIWKEEATFWARAGGSGGTYSAGESPVWHPSDGEKAKLETRRILIEKLIADGWQPIEGLIGSSEQRFRRRAK